MKDVHKHCTYEVNALLLEDSGLENLDLKVTLLLALDASFAVHSVNPITSTACTSIFLPPSVAC